METSQIVPDSIPQLDNTERSLFVDSEEDFSEEDLKGDSEADEGIVEDVIEDGVTVQDEEEEDLLT